MKFNWILLELEIQDLDAISKEAVRRILRARLEEMSGPKILRSIRIDEETWSKIKGDARSKNKTVSDNIRELLDKGINREFNDNFDLE